MDKEDKPFSSMRMRQNGHSSVGHEKAESKLDLESVGWSSSLVRTLALRAKGRRFKSGSAHSHFSLAESIVELFAR